MAVSQIIIDALYRGKQNITEAENDQRKLAAAQGAVAVKARDATRALDKLDSEVASGNKNLDKAQKEYDQLSKELDSYKRKMGSGGAAGATDKFSASIGSLVTGGALLAAGHQIAQFASESVNLASDAAETASLIDSSLGSAADEFRQKIEAVGDATGRSTTQLEQGASTIIAMSRSMGFGQKAAADYSATWASVALDLGSFFNQPTEQVLEDIQGALAGSSETLQKYGIDVRENTLKQAALDQGLIKTGESLDRVTRAQVIQQQVMAQASDAIGDAERTAGGYANKQRALADATLELKTAIGEQLLPAATKVVTVLADWATSAAKAAKEQNELRKRIEESGISEKDRGKSLALMAQGVTDTTVATRALNEAEGSRRTSAQANLEVTKELNDAVAESAEVQYESVFALRDSARAYESNVEAAQQLHAQRLAQIDATKAAAQAEQENAQALVASFDASKSLFAELAAAQSEASDTIGGASEQEAARVVAAQEAIQQSYKNTALEKALAAADNSAEVERALEFGVGIGAIDESAANARLEFAKTNEAIAELTGLMDSGAISVSTATDAFNALTEGQASTTEEALILAERAAILDKAMQTTGSEVLAVSGNVGELKEQLGRVEGTYDVVVNYKINTSGSAPSLPNSSLPDLPTPSFSPAGGNSFSPNVTNGFSGGSLYAPIVIYANGGSGDGLAAATEDGLIRAAKRIGLNV